MLRFMTKCREKINGGIPNKEISGAFFAGLPTEID